MSNTGGAAVGVVGIAVVGAPLLVVAGAGVLAVEGLMWCGDQLHRAYEMQQEKARASWQAEAQRRAAASQQLRTSQEMFVQMEVARWQEANPSLKHPASLIASAVADSVAQARTRLGNGATGTSGADELALRQARLRLRSLRMAA
ncbi:MAG TPA: hypothetical protein VJR48_04190, partial [Ktedonobacterales bacterium]|nr:hypothetical protein [Ktedonobacterales bacterium]